MNHFVLAATVAAASFTFASSQASACTVPAQSSDPCEYFDPTGQNPNGTVKMPLTQQVEICHPNWQNLNFQDETRKRWFSYAIYLDGQLADLVRSLRNPAVSWTDEIELSPGVPCHERYAAANWNFAIFDPCEVPGYNVLRVAPEFVDGQTLDSFEEWPIVTGADGKPLLFDL